MENNKSLLKCDRVYVTDKIYVRIPTVGEILDNEKKYLNLVHTLTAVPYQYMVQLDDAGLDFTKVKEYELFLMLFSSYLKEDVSILFGDLDISDYRLCGNSDDSMHVLKSEKHGDDYQIDEFVYFKLVEAIRKINNIEKIKYKPANEETKRYLIEKERKYLKRHAKDKYKPYLENLVIALVNNKDFKYNYDEVMDLSYFRFNQSFNQIQTNITFDKTMNGIYSGTVDTSKLKDKSCLSWIQQGN